MSDTTLLTGDGCAMCGAPIDLTLKDCNYCGAPVIITDIYSADPADRATQNNLLNKWKEKLKADPGSVTANYTTGMIYMLMQLPELAVPYFKKTVDLAPEFAMAHYNYSLALFNEGVVAAGAEALCVSEMNYALKLNPQLKEAAAYVHFFKGNKIAGADRQAAISEYRKAIELCGNVGVFYNNMGMVYLKAGDYKHAGNCFVRALGISKKHLAFYSNMVLVHYKTKQYQQGASLAEEAEPVERRLASDATKANFYNNYALCLWKTKGKNEALKKLKIARSYDANNALVNKNIGSIGSGCFVATATMGSYDHPVVMELRTFRDEWLLARPWGQRFVSWYYLHSPACARIISQSRALRRLSYCFIVWPLYQASKIIKGRA